MNENTEQQQDGSKVSKKFEDNKAILIGILQGDIKTLMGGTQLENPEIQAAIEELLKEKKEALAKEVKDSVSKLLTEYLEFERFQKEKEQEFKKAISERMKKFNSDCDAIFNKIKGFKSLSSDYYRGLRAVSSLHEDEDGATGSSTQTPDPPAEE